jgi:predicted NBD/HSP70 family sugar kinase
VPSTTWRAQTTIGVRQAVFDAGWILGRALIPIVEFVDPDVIVIVGRMRHAHTIYTEAVANGLGTQPRRIGKMPNVVAGQTTATSILGAIRNTLQNQPPVFPDHLRRCLDELRRDMQAGPPSWQRVAPLLGPAQTNAGDSPPASSTTTSAATSSAGATPSAPPNA